MPSLFRLSHSSHLAVWAATSANWTVIVSRVLGARGRVVWVLVVLGRGPVNGGLWIGAPLCGVLNWGARCDVLLWVRGST